ncbi:hypothetical protein PRIPAC_76653, partial [Pristionchus pacificus]|uniref:Uncharacterized protein n=1 Tax=Pristionchus pacificus TaxID=54126 RepID=A0A2A6C5R0_PRIPA
MEVGCFGNSPSRTFCTCNSDLCNSNSFNITEISDPAELFDMEVICPEQNEAGQCTSPTCMFSNVSSRFILYSKLVFIRISRNICRYFDQPPSFYSLYPNAIFIDQSSKIETDNMNKPIVVPTYSHLTFCTKKECEQQYNIEERSRNYTTDKAVVACYTNSDFHESSNDTYICYGHACYANNFNGTTTRGCFYYAFDTMWSNGRSQFLYLLEDRRNEKVTFHQFLLLEYYLCNYDYCNAD